MRKNQYKEKLKIADIAIYVLLTVLGIIWVLPIVYLIYTAFRVTPSTGIINSLFPTGLRGLDIMRF